MIGCQCTQRRTHLHTTALLQPAAAQQPTTPSGNTLSLMSMCAACADNLITAPAVIANTRCSPALQGRAQHRGTTCCGTVRASIVSLLRGVAVKSLYTTNGRLRLMVSCEHLAARTWHSGTRLCSCADFRASRARPESEGARSAIPSRLAPLLAPVRRKALVSLFLGR